MLVNKLANWKSWCYADILGDKSIQQITEAQLQPLAAGMKQELLDWCFGATKLTKLEPEMSSEFPMDGAAHHTAN
jgi:hypothetical protein